MTLKRLVAPFALFASLALVSAAFGQDTGGGVLAPATSPSAEPAAAQPEAPPAEATQEDQPTTPEGEEQPPEEQPDGEQPPTEEPGEVDGLPENGAPAAGDGGGTLPETGLRLVALTSIGLGLLLAGAALWPTSSWPPPRDPRSRSTTRRYQSPPRPPRARPRTR